MNVKEYVKNYEKELITIRRDLHQIPEVGFELHHTVSYVKEKLKSWGIPFQEDVGSPCSIVAMVEGQNKRPEKTIALRADMDALPVKECTDLPFRSCNGKMHACGHDAHTAILLITAKILKEQARVLKGRVKFIFQPAEELGTGSLGLVEQGVMDDVDEIIGLHVGNISEEGALGNLVFSKGSMMACMDKFRLKVIGKGAHGAYPARSVDPIVIFADIVVALQDIVSREIEAVEPAVITVGKVKAGSAFNIIPESLEAEGTVRAVTQKTREFVAKRIEEIAKGIAQSMRGDIEYEFFYQPPPLVNHKEVTEKVMASAQKLYPDDIREMKTPVMGGEDFARYLEKKPGCFFFLNNPLPIDGEIWAHHNPKFAIDENYLDRGVCVFVQYIMDQLA